MDAAHARPMTAYAALCAAAVVVLAQGMRTSPPVVDAIAQAGPPAWIYAQTVTMAATEQVTDRVTDRVRDLSTSIASTSFLPGLAAGHERASGPAAADTKVQSGRTARPQQVAEAVTIEPATRDLGPVSSSKVHERTSVDRKADRAAARDARKADRASAKGAKKAHRGPRHR